MSRAGEHFRQILVGPNCTTAAPIFDPLSARIASMVGWNFCKLSGSVAKAAALAIPDGVPIASMSDLVDICQRILRAANVTLIVDADDAGGGPLSVRRTVQELESVGVAGIEIEDNRVPSRLAPANQRHADFVPKEEQVGRLRAAVAAKRDSSTAIVARTSAFTLLSRGEAIDRIVAYSTTGADALMIVHPRDRSDIEAAHAACTLPLIVIGLDPEDAADTEFLNANHVRVRYFLGHLPYRMAVGAIHEALERLKIGKGVQNLEERVASPEVLADVVRVNELSQWEHDYSSPDVPVDAG